MKAKKTSLLVLAGGIALLAAQAPAHALNPQPIPPGKQRAFLTPGVKQACMPTSSRYGILRIGKDGKPLPPNPCRR